MGKVIFEGEQVLSSYEEAELYFRKCKKHESRYTGEIKKSMFKENKVAWEET